MLNEFKVNEMMSELFDGTERDVGQRFYDPEAHEAAKSEINRQGRVWESVRGLLENLDLSPMQAGGPYSYLRSEISTENPSEALLALFNSFSYHKIKDTAIGNECWSEFGALKSEFQVEWKDLAYMLLLSKISCTLEVLKNKLGENNA